MSGNTPPSSSSASSTSATGAGTSAAGGAQSVQQVATSAATMSVPPTATTVVTAHAGQAGPGVLVVMLLVSLEVKLPVLEVTLLELTFLVEWLVPYLELE
ncbi:hypothetical protein PF002_g27574 [Phytophthora fragariae]|uniref:Uncharacterized protein n=1 Tax=Phytophthora fragariae TaxID=53985 RepID=A0A6A3WDE6_9STRA|nr:hypothetical protein PF009_g27538 [Phytophthora fragariae]KAE9180417.1 hypothetical protein PF002_g27574 [Phytophthora fragariae]